METHKILQGILALVDIVNFTPQATKLGEKNTARFIDYFQEKVKTTAQKQDYRVVKTLGDAVLLFGTDIEGVLEIMLDLFDREKLEDRHGFDSRFRMVAHSGFFQFQWENGEITDLVSPEGIKVFRMEKHAQSWELVVTQALYQGIQSLLTSKGLEAQRLVLAEPLKGFDNENWPAVFYRLHIAREQEGVSNLLEPQLNRLEQEVQNIPVFGNIYPPVPMENNFINLSLVCDEEKEPGDRGRYHADDDLDPDRDMGQERLRKERRIKWPFHDFHEDDGERREQTPLREITVSGLYEKYRGGFILGLPGAGKTTILRYLAYREFKENEAKAENQKQVVLFVPCRDIPLYDTWYKQRHAAVPGTPNPDEALEFFTWVFLLEKATPKDLAPDQWVEFQDTGKQVKQAFNENRVTLLVDALDEAADTGTRERIKQLFLILYTHPGRDRIFLTSRPSERIHLDREFRQCKVPVFNVLSLTQDQVRAVARHLMEEDSGIYKNFDQAIWQEEVVVKMAATPITALLITAYFQAYEKFDHRFPMYDLLVKFILLKVWDSIKTGAFPYRNLELFFQEIKAPGFFKKHKETRILYDALASLCFNLFYDSADGTVQRSVNEETMQLHFSNFIREHIYYYDEETARAEAYQWQERFKRDHLLLQAGKREYVFVHSTVMEFLAAYYLIEKYQKDNTQLPQLLRASLGRENLLELETVPIAAGYSLLAGYAILAALRDLVGEISYPKAGLYSQAVQCLAEVEWLLRKTFRALRIKSLKKPILNIINRNYQSVNWLYNYLKEQVLEEDKERLKQSVEGYGPQLKLSRDTLLEEYLDYEVFDKGDSELVDLREKLLRQLVQKEVVEQWLSRHRKAVPVERRGEAVVEEIALVEAENALQLDSPGYHMEDKNFKYFQHIIGKELAGFFGSPNMRHSRAVRGCAFSPDGKTFVSASADGTLTLWEVDSGKEIRAFTGHKSAVLNCAFSQGGTHLASASRDQTLKLWEVESGKEIRAFTGHKAAVVSCAFSPGGTHLASASDDNTLKLWEVAGGKEIHAFTGHKDAVVSCAFSPGGTHLVSASYDHTLKLWEVESGKEIRAFTGHKAAVWGCAFSPGGTHLASASYDNTLKLWEVDSGMEIRAFTGHKDWVLSCAFSPGGTHLASASRDQTLKLWEVAGGKEIHAFTGHQDAVWGCAFSPGGTHLVSASEDRTLKLWEVDSGKEIRAFTGHKDAVRSCAFSQQRTHLVSASRDQTLKLWEISSGQEIRAFTGHKSYVLGCAFSPDGTHLASASDDNTLKLWEVASGKEIRTFTGHQDAVWGCAFSPQGTHLVSASRDHTLKLWEVGSGKGIRTFTGHQDAVWSCAFSLEGTHLVSASTDKTSRLWEVASGKEIRVFSAHNGYVTNCIFSPQGTHLISSSSDKTLKLLEASSGKEIRAFTGHKGTVLSCAFSPAGTRLVSASKDQTLKLWETASGKCLKTLTLPWTPLYVSFSPTTPGLIVTANPNGTLTLFDFKEYM